MCALAPGLVHPDAPSEHARSGSRVDGELKVSGQMLYSNDLPLDRACSMSPPSAAPIPTPASCASTRPRPAGAGRAAPCSPAPTWPPSASAGPCATCPSSPSTKSASPARWSPPSPPTTATPPRKPPPSSTSSTTSYRPSSMPSRRWQPTPPLVHDTALGLCRRRSQAESEPPNLMGRAAGERGDVDGRARRVRPRLRAHLLHPGPSPGLHRAPLGHRLRRPRRHRPDLVVQQVARTACASSWPWPSTSPIEQITAPHRRPIGGDFGGKGSPMDMPLCLRAIRAAPASPSA